MWLITVKACAAVIAAILCRPSYKQNVMFRCFIELILEATFRPCLGLSVSSDQSSLILLVW